MAKPQRFIYPESIILHMAGEGENRKNKELSRLCPDRYEVLLRQVDFCREHNSTFTFGATGITIRRDPKKVPYVHGEEQRGGTAERYEISHTSHEIGECEVEDFSYTVPESSPMMEAFLRSAAEAMAFWKTFDVRAESPTKPLDEKIDAFLRRHGIDGYSELVKGADYDSFTGEDYEGLPKNSLRRKLFHYRATVMLAALAAAEEQGHDIAGILEEVGNSMVYPIKKSCEEPTFGYIRRKLERS
jgi:hypothetical protein